MASDHHPTIAAALGSVRQCLQNLGLGRILVACSGGPDSVALLGLLLRLRASMGVRLAVGHVDHGLREASAAEGQAVAAVAARYGLEFRGVRLELARGPGIPARARERRRAALQMIAAELACDAIALGHTATDQAETMLLHLTRGAGLEGLAAMSALEPGDPLPWVRPVLHLTRAQTRELAARMGLGFVDDPTNEDVGHPRVAVRSGVLPVLRGFRPGAELAMAAAAEHARDAQDAVMWVVKRELLERRLPDGWSLRNFRALPVAIRTAWLRAVCAAEGVDMSSLGRRTIASIDRSLGSGVGGRRCWHLRPLRCLWIESDRLWVTT